jgi:hypothetical protein
MVRIIGYAIAKTFSKVFGLATITFFGRVPSRDDDKVGAVGLIAITWFPVLAAIPFPALGEMLFPILEDEAIIRGLAIFLAITMPPTAGFLVAQVHNRRHEGGAAVLREMVYGYWYCAYIGLLVITLIIVVPVVKASYILRMFDLKHIAVMVAEGTYDDVVRQVRGALKRHGIETTVERPSWPIYRIFTALAWMEGHIFRREVAPDMLQLVGETPNGDRVEITVHATDISILGKKEASSLAFAVLAEELDERYLYLTWDDRSQQVEDRIRDLSAHVERTGEPVSDEEIHQLCTDLRYMSLEADEWNAVRRQLFRLEAASLRLRAGEDQPLEDAATYLDGSEEEASAAGESSSSP